jgi:hypothetical protein
MQTPRPAVAFITTTTNSKFSVGTLQDILIASNVYLIPGDSLKVRRRRATTAFAW